MTGPDEPATNDQVADGGEAALAREAAEIAAFLAAEDVANDYQPHRLVGDVVD